MVLEGLISEQKFGKAKTLTSLVPAIELQDYFSVFEAPTELESALSDITNRINEKRISAICEQIRHGLKGDVPEPHLQLTFALMGKGNIKTTHSGKLAQLCYQQKNTLVVDGILVLYAILLLLGFEEPFVTKKLTKERILQDSAIRQKLCTLQVLVAVVLDDTSGLSSEDLVYLFKQYNTRETNLHSALFERVDTETPIVSFVRQLADELGINSMGGMKTSSNRINKDEGYLTTEATMIRLVLGVVGGAYIQNRNSIPSKLSNGTQINAQQLNKTKPYIVSFMKTWLKNLKSQFSTDRNGYHNSTQIWQVLGLVLNDLIERGYTTKELALAAKHLAELDYSRNAPHWTNCDAMELDVSGKQYKNATNGGRTFREKLAEYFIDLV